MNEPTYILEYALEWMEQGYTLEESRMLAEASLDKFQVDKSQISDKHRIYH